MFFRHAGTKFMCRKCGVGLKLRPKLLNNHCVRNASRANKQALAQSDSLFELEVLSPEAECVPDHVAMVGDPGDALCVLSDVGVVDQPGAHDLDDSQASPYA